MRIRNPHCCWARRAARRSLRLCSPIFPSPSTPRCRSSRRWSATAKPPRNRCRKWCGGSSRYRSPHRPMQPTRSLAQSVTRTAAKVFTACGEPVIAYAAGVFFDRTGRAGSPCDNARVAARPAPMIGRLSGTLVEKNPPQILLDVQDVAYEVDVPMSTFYNLPNLGERVTLFTHLVVREDAHLLFGFGSESERRAFRKLIKISGTRSPKF